MKVLALASILAVAVGCSAPGEAPGSREDHATSDIDRMFKRADGNFDVWCTNGTTETGITAERLMSNQVCGGGATPSTSTTNAELVFHDVKRTLERAQFGFDADGTLHIEAHEGGDPACPGPSSPSPKRTLIVTGVKKTAAAGTTLTKADGVALTLVDFDGAQIPDAPFSAKATEATITVVALTDTTADLELTATFANGTAKGHLHATFCQSLSE